MTRRGTFVIEPLGPFSLDQSAAFASAFSAASARLLSDERLAFALTDDDGLSAAVAVRQSAAAAPAEIEYVSDLSSERVQRHAARVLSLDVDARSFELVGRRDPVIAELQQRFPGLRPFLFGTPFEAACWAVMSQRTSMRHASVVKQRLSEQLGEELELRGSERLRAFPAPGRIVDLEHVPGLSATKTERLRGLARAALEGALDADALRALEPEDALERLESIPGIGPFSAMLVLARGAGHPDVLSVPIRRLRLAVANAYGIPEQELDDGTLERLNDRWRPYRSWALFLIRNAYGE